MALKVAILFLITIQLFSVNSESILKDWLKWSKSVKEWDDLIRIRQYQIDEINLLLRKYRMSCITWADISYTEMRREFLKLGMNFTEIESQYPNLKSDCVDEKNRKLKEFEKKYYMAFKDTRNNCSDLVRDYYDRFIMFESRLHTVSKYLNVLLIDCPIRYYAKETGFDECFKNGLDYVKDYMGTFYKDLLSMYDYIKPFEKDVESKYDEIYRQIREYDQKLIGDYKNCLAGN